MTRATSCFISAGEFSGDLLAASLVESLKEIIPGVEFYGIAGDEMKKVGVKAIASISELSVMGFAEVAKKIGPLRMIEDRILSHIDRIKPNLAILVDFPGFHFRLAPQLKMRSIPVVQYVAPKLWAWGEGRAKRLRDDFDLVLGLFPFEVEFFTSRGVNYQYIGTPQLDRIQNVKGVKRDFLVEENQTLVAMLPGSRPNEIIRIMPSMKVVKDLIKEKRKDLTFFVPVAPNLDLHQVTSFLPGELKQLGDGRFYKDDFYFIHGRSLELMAASDACLVASGTATLECALLETPMVVIYKLSPLTYKIAKRKVKIPWVGLVNILSQKEVAKEYIQEFAPKDVAEKLSDILFDQAIREKMISELKELKQSLKAGAERRAAKIIQEQYFKKSC